VKFELPHPVALSWSLDFPVLGKLQQALLERENEDFNQSEQ